MVLNRLSEVMQMAQQKPHSDKKLLRTAAGLSGLAIQMGLTIYLGNLLGVWLDSTYNKTYLEDTVTLFAVFLAIYFVIKKVVTLNK